MLHECQPFFEKLPVLEAFSGEIQSKNCKKGDGAEYEVFKLRKAAKQRAAREKQRYIRAKCASSSPFFLPFPSVKRLILG